jgi:hypothetical protein
MDDVPAVREAKEIRFLAAKVARDDLERSPPGDQFPKLSHRCVSIARRDRWRIDHHTDDGHLWGSFYRSPSVCSLKSQPTWRTDIVCAQTFFWRRRRSIHASFRNRGRNRFLIVMRATSLSCRQRMEMSGRCGHKLPSNIYPPHPDPFVRLPGTRLVSGVGGV